MIQTASIREASDNSKAGRLFIVATPIGNLGDISARAIQTLNSVDLILSEDTRQGRKLCTHFTISTALHAFHDHNESTQTPIRVAEMLEGKVLALISDAGTPLVSDPGYKLVDAAQTAGIEVVAIPGPCAIIAALSVAGLPTDRFYFEGFLPAKAVARTTILNNLSTLTCTVIVYESKHRILASLEAMSEVLGSDRQIVVARELTKRFETVIRGSTTEVLHYISAEPTQQKGEFVVLIHGADPTQSSYEADPLLTTLLKHLPTKQAAKAAHEISGLSKNELYQRALTLNKK